MTRYGHDQPPLVLTWGYFFSCSSEQKQYLMDVGIFIVLQSILDGFIHSTDVIAEVFCVIACLSDIRKFCFYMSVCLSLPLVP